MKPYDGARDIPTRTLAHRVTSGVLLAVTAVAVAGCVGWTGGSLWTAGAAPKVVYIEQPAVATATPIREPVNISPVTVLLAGDSTAVNSYDAWEASGVDLVTVPDSFPVEDRRGVARSGCPLVRMSTGWQQKYGTGAECDWSTWVPQVAAVTHPDVVVASFGWFLGWDYKRVGDDAGPIDWVRSDGPVLAVTLDEIAAFEAAVSPARVLWVTYPSTVTADPGFERMNDSARNADLWPLLFTPGPCVADLAAWTRDNVSGAMFRDGAHFTEAVQTAAVGFLTEQVAICAS